MLANPAVITEIWIIICAFGMAYRLSADDALPQFSVALIMVGALTAGNAFGRFSLSVHVLSPF